MISYILKYAENTQILMLRAIVKGFCESRHMHSI